MTPNAEPPSAQARDDEVHGHAAARSGYGPAASGGLRHRAGACERDTGLDAFREGMRLLSWSPYSCRRAELGNGRSRELIIPFGGAGYIILFEVVGDDVLVGAVRHQREEDYRH